jgi:hypothetical protein
MRWWRWLVGGGTDDVARVTRGIIVLLLTLAGGTLALLLLQALVRVSEWTVFGVWGVVGVVVVALLLALVVLWRRPARPSRGGGVPPAAGGGPGRIVRTAPQCATAGGRCPDRARPSAHAGRPDRSRSAGALQGAHQRPDPAGAPRPGRGVAGLPGAPAGRSRLRGEHPPRPPAASPAPVGSARSGRGAPWCGVRASAGQATGRQPVGRAPDIGLVAHLQDQARLVR